MVVPLDGSRLGEAALPYVRELVRKAKAELVLATCVEPHSSWDISIVVEVLERDKRLARDYLSRQRKDLVTRGLKVRSRLLQGSVAESLLNLASRERADLMALATHGRSGLSRWLLGSVATKLIQSAGLPLLIVRPSEEPRAEAEEEVSMRRILVPLDGSKAAESVIPYVRDLALTLGATVTLYHAFSLLVFPGDETPQPAAKGVLEDMEDQSPDFLLRAGEQMMRRGVATQLRVSADLPVRGILRAARETGADLIAVGTHGRSGLARATIGSLAEGVVRESRLPCLIVSARRRATGAKTRSLGARPPRSAK